MEIFNQVVCALINLVIAQVQALRDQLCKHCTINIDSTWQDQSNHADEPLNVERESHEEESGERQKSIEKKLDSARTCILTEEESAKNTDAFSLWSTDEKEKLLLCVAKIFQIQFPLYTAYKHNTHPTIEVYLIFMCIFNYFVKGYLFSLMSRLCVFGDSCFQTGRANSALLLTSVEVFRETFKMTHTLTVSLKYA